MIYETSFFYMEVTNLQQQYDRPSNVACHQRAAAGPGLLGSMFLQPSGLPLALVVVLSVVLIVVLLSSPFPYWMILLRSQTEMPSLSQSLYHGSLITGEQPKVCSTVSSPPPRCFHKASPILGPCRGSRGLSSPRCTP